MKYAISLHYGPTDSPSLLEDENFEEVFNIDIFAYLNALSFNIPPLLKILFDEGLVPSEDALDLLLLGAAVFGADTHLSREGTSENAWTREIYLSIPVVSIEKWAPLVPTLESMLRFLSGDLWTIAFRSRPKTVPALVKKPKEKKIFGYSCVSLFSGGLDSFIGAIDCLEDKHDPIFVSHSWVTGASHHQTMCLNRLKTQYSGKTILHLPGRVAFPKDAMAEMSREDTERSRSFLFFSMAALAASSLGKEVPIFVPENGLISLNVPIDHLRLGSLSTRTTHPFVIARFNDVMKGIGIEAKLVNPYAHKTKGEMVAECKNPAFLKKNITSTMSCSSPGKGRFQGLSPGHCGHCVPCIIRRASLQDVGGGDPTKYTIEDLRERPLNCSKAEGEHIRSFQLAVQSLGANPKRAKIIIRKPGSLRDCEGEIEELAGVYLRGMGEISRLLHRVVTRPL